MHNADAFKIVARLIRRSEREKRMADRLGVVAPSLDPVACAYMRAARELFAAAIDLPIPDVDADWPEAERMELP